MNTDDIEKKFVIDVAELSRYTPGREAPIWWGVVGLILIEMSVVAAFVVSAFYLQMINEQWPPPGVDVPEVLIPTLSMLIMLFSCVTMYLAGRAVNNNKIKPFVVYTFVSVFLAGVTLFIRWQKFHAFEFRWDEHVYGSLVWTITGFHFTHIVSAAIGTFVIGIAGVVGFFNNKRQIGVVVDTLYWNFVAIAWIPFYFVLYWAPRLFQG